jgi:glycosyltransferase involved in cell wall biosynthesis
MRIAQICHRYYPHIGGIEHHVKEISERLAKKHEVEVITADLDTSLKVNERINDVNIHRFRAFTLHDAYYLSPQIGSYLKKSDFDIVHAHNYHAFPALFAAFSVQAKFIFTPHYHGKGSTRGRNILNKPYKFIAYRIFQRADTIICVSNYEKNLIERDFPRIDLKKMTIIPNGINLEPIQNARPFEIDEKILLYIGRLEKYKNIDLIIRALKLLPDYHFYIIGSSGSYKPELLNLIAEMKLDDRVRILEHVSDAEKYRWLKSCSLFINLSGIEAFGITVLEALAAEKPVIVNESGGLGEFGDMFSGVYPITVDNDQNEFVELLAKAINNTKKIPIRADLNEYSWDKIVDRIENVYLKDHIE